LSRRKLDAMAQRKALLSSHASLERAQLTLALHEVRAMVSPRRLLETRGKSRATSMATALVGVGVPLLGRSRLARLLKAGSILVTAWRLTSNWRRAG
jgi:hypothetical protein